MRKEIKSIPIFLILCLAFMAIIPFPIVNAVTILRVQGNARGTTITNSISVTMASTPISGNILIATIGTYGSTSQITVSSISQANVVWSIQTSKVSGGSPWIECEIWLGVISASASKSITITLSGSSPNGGVANICEYSGVAVSSPLDKTASATGNNNAPITGTTATTTETPELAIGAIASNYNIHGSPTNGYSLLDGAMTTYLGFSYLEKILSGTQTTSSGVTTSTSNYWYGCVATFKPKPPTYYYLTYRFNSGGQFLANGTVVTNGTVVQYLNTTYACFGACPSNSNYIFKNFTWSGGNSLTNWYSYQVLGNKTIWCYFDSVPVATPYTLARFNFNPSNPYINTTIIFDAMSSETSSYFTDYNFTWGDGSFTSGSSYTIHSYNSIGNYTVIFKAISAIGWNSTTQVINVTDTPISVTPYIISRFNFNMSNIYINSTVLFNGTLSISSSNITSYYWDFGDNQTSINSMPTHSYNSIGNYTVSLNVTSSDGWDITSQIINVTENSEEYFYYFVLCGIGILICVGIILLVIAKRR